MNAVNEATEIRLLRTLEHLEARLQRIEQRMDIPVSAREEFDDIDPGYTGATDENEGQGLEYRIGRIWLPRIGVVVLTLGIVFLLTLPLSVLPHLIANTLGFVLSGMILAASAIWRKTFPEFARYLVGGGMLLLFFSTMRLHFFGADPVVPGITVEIVLLLLVVAVNLWLALRADSMFLAAMSMGMGFLAVLCSPADHVLLGGILFFVVLSSILAYRRRWSGLLSTTVCFAAVAHILWSLNNPLFGTESVIRSEPFVNLLYLLAYIVVTGVTNLRMSERDGEHHSVVFTAILIASLPLMVLFFLTLTTFSADLAMTQLLAFLVYAGLAVASWKRVSSRYPTFFYTMVGNLALSAAIFQQFAIPDNFLWLCLQSFVVISLAIWFRSRIIVVTNFMIFISIVFAYLVLVDSITAVSLAFGFVAVLSARIMNWQHDRLELKADMLRNAYLLTALFIFPYTLYHLLPSQYVSLSWVGIAALYYLLSKLLDNFKYRWMALTTLIAAVIHLMIAGTTSLEPTYRIISFIVVGIVLLGVSLLYFKSSAKQQATAQQEESARPGHPEPEK